MATNIVLPLRFNHTEKLITTVSQIVVPASAERKYLLFVNDSDTTIYLNLDRPAAANSGLRLNANGGSYEMDTGAKNMSLMQVTAIHSGAGEKRLIITEGV